MPRNSGGVYTPPSGTYGITGEPIASVPYNTFVNDLATEITNSLNVNGTAAMLANLNMGTQRIVNLAAPINPNDAATMAYVASALPSGVVTGILSPTGIAPAGWLVGDGSSYTTATYPNLFAVIGYTFGGSGANFSVPDLRGLFLRGWGASDTYDPGRVFGTYQADQIASHSHGVNDPGHSHFSVQTAHTHTDNGHSHGITQTNHTHQFGNIQSGSGIASGSGWAQVTGPTGGATANITINNGFASLQPAAPAISVTANGTGITTQLYGGPGDGHETAVKNMTVLWIIKT